MTDSVKIPLFKKADLDASIGVFFDGFSKVIVAVAILLGTFGLDGATVFGTMMPGVLVNVIVLNGGLWLYYRHVAKSRGDRDLTAIPAGLQAGRMFIWLYSIMLPVYNTTGDAQLLLNPGTLVRRLRLVARYEGEASAEKDLYYHLPGFGYTSRLRVWPTAQPDGSWLYTLPRFAGQGLRPQQCGR